MSRSRIGLCRVRAACGLLALCLAVAAVSSLSAAHAAPSGRVLRILIPRRIDPGKLTLLCKRRGTGMTTIERVDTKDGVRKYSVDLRDVNSVKLLVYCPGYRMVTAEFDTRRIADSKAFTPRFVRVPMVPLRVRLVDTDGRPLVGEQVSLRHSLLEMEYFNYMTGMVWPAVVATATTGGDGEIALDVPSLADDPYFADADTRRRLWLELRSTIDSDAERLRAAGHRHSGLSRQDQRICRRVVSGAR